MSYIKNLSVNLNYQENDMDIPILTLNNTTEILAVILSYKISVDRILELVFNETCYEISLKSGEYLIPLGVLNKYKNIKEVDTLFAIKRDFDKEDEISLNIILDFKDENNLRSCL